MSLVKFQSFWLIPKSQPQTHHCTAGNLHIIVQQQYTNGEKKKRKVCFPKNTPLLLPALFCSTNPPPTPFTHFTVLPSSISNSPLSLMLSSSSTGGEDSSHHGAGAGNTTSSSDQYPDPAYPTTFPNPRTMEEVWKDINLSSLHDQCPTPGGDHQHHHHNHNRNHHHRRHQNQNFIFQDFFSRPFDQDPLPSRFPPSSPASAAAPPPSRDSPLPTHATVLSLHSGSAGLPPASTHLQPHQMVSTEYPIPFNNTQFDDGLDCSASLLNPFQRKRVQDSDDGGGGGGDRRHKRMIKNRESAARSRARKQAYTNELELEVQHLLAENAKLKKQQEELRVAAASSQVAKRSTLFRTSTAPF